MVASFLDKTDDNWSKNSVHWRKLLIVFSFLGIADGWVVQSTPWGHRRLNLRLDAVKDRVVGNTNQVNEKLEPEANNGKKSRSKTTKTKVNTESAHWLDDQDESLMEYNKDGSLLAVRFKVRGNPRPLVRHRTARGIVYSPSSGLQESFRDRVFQIMASEGKNLAAPLFREEDCLVMSVVLRMKRPKSHFVASRPGPDRLKATAPKAISQSRTDVDNLVKFVMDSMNQVLYPDDRQIASLHVTKVLDNEGLCEGSTEIYLRAIGEEDFDVVTMNSFQITKG